MRVRDHDPGNRHDKADGKRQNDYDRTRALFDGTVQIAGYETIPLRDAVHAGFSGKISSAPEYPMTGGVIRGGILQDQYGSGRRT
jgi:hypothetical protein